ncbi:MULTISPECIES: ubiquinol-cytochrome c reductase iron-sulfur subunit [Thermomonas]|jgi:ubiquinol-cytochrome c reductase iron-sulfur subunit|uniref:Ubiquinol-cytochrome c reductase iron-sulfur subunit n=1 Tax=Thermomonas beijingensis TaxID=2872701 RepID=A0ABS7TCK2_9GAMM|nr:MULTISPECIES: ubiquinol-cytochrome c reductase iron-sulfur subunit [Thermomonas]MBS0459113.1 ubiquinol-cytochrome c reductase iron-sulfur subunit [Pseudomonadota bacterium]MBZ4185537.1 ubiquinol-cytochrome c reductase iron-sulfur subunit [Thermomonas beijingensis]HOC11887.1 ubiquinol-cytochrome c reductase iron-sulfur subunit [Thermomonas sp.]HQE06725.1 ubiquinol-cytochrome c reductase iron-sulfur subunit [Thermomonas sp.]
MANEEVNVGRRRFLTATTAVVGAVGAGFAAVPFIKSWSPSARARFAGAPVTQDISALVEGQQMVINWRGQPIYIAKRSKAMLEVMKSLDPTLADPNSTNADQQPKYAQNPTRSIKPEISVLVGVCTHLGCAPEFLPEVKPEPFDPNWKGGYFCPCHKSRYDLAGRVLKAQPAPANLPVPPYHFENDNTLVIGVDPKGAA